MATYEVVLSGGQTLPVALAPQESLTGLLTIVVSDQGAALLKAVRNCTLAQAASFRMVVTFNVEGTDYVNNSPVTCMPAAP